MSPDRKAPAPVAAPERADRPALPFRRDRVLWSAFAHHAQVDPDGLAVVDGDRRVSRRELHALVEGASAVLAGVGVARRTRIVSRGRTDLGTVVVGLAASRLGAVLAPIPATFGWRDTRDILDRVAPAAFVCAARDLDGPARPGTPSVSFEALLAGAAPVPPATPLALDEVALIGFTAGTTGSPKGVMLTSAALNHSTGSWAEIVGLAAGDRVLGLLPMSYMAGFAFGVHLTASARVAVVCLRKWDPDQALDLMEREEVVWAPTISTHVLGLVDAVERRGRPARLPRLQALTCGGAPMTEELIERGERVLGTRVLRAYGLSECLSAAVMRRDDPDADRYLYDGWPIANTDIEAFDEDGQVLPRGTVGMGGMRGPALFSGYFGDPAHTAATFGGAGFLMTGDLIVRTEEGYVRVVGRIKDLIIRGGLNIDPVEIEDVLRTHDDVRDVAVVGVPDERLGEIVCACVVLAEGRHLDLAGAVAFLEEAGLAKQQLPQRLEVVDEIPRSDVGKIVKRTLRDRVLAGSGAGADGSSPVAGRAEAPGEPSPWPR